MKKIFLILTIVMIGATSFAQNKNAKATIEVDGVCMMCKERIEKAAIKATGVKSAVWNVENHQLSLIYNETKTDLGKIQASIANAGHDTKDIKAKEEVYETLDPCCKYRDAQVVDDHKN